MEGGSVNFFIGVICAMLAAISVADHNFGMAGALAFTAAVQLIDYAKRPS